MVQGRAPQSKVRYIRKRKRRSAAPVFGMWLFLLLCSLLAAYYFVHSAYFSLENIEITGNKTLSAQQVIELSGLAEGVNIFTVDAQEAALKIKMHPSVKGVSVSRRIPATLIFRITERNPVALVAGQDGFLLIDEETVCIKKISDIQGLQLPIISGVKTDPNLRPGASLGTEGLNTAIKLISMLDKDFLKNVAEIMAPSSLSLSLKTIQGVEVRFGEPVQLDRKIKLMNTLIFDNGAIINSDTVEYIDLRYDTAPVIRRKD